MNTLDLDMLSIVFLSILFIFCILYDFSHKARLFKLYMAIQSYLLGHSQTIWDHLDKEAFSEKKIDDKHEILKRQKRKSKKNLNMKINTNLNPYIEKNNTELNASEKLRSDEENDLSDFGKNSTAENSPRNEDSTANEKKCNIFINEEEFFIDTYKSEYGLFSGPCIERIPIDAVMNDFHYQCVNFN